MELLLIYEGCLSLHIGDREITANEKSLVIIPPERAHMGISGDDGVRYRTVMFDPAIFYNLTNATDKFLKPIVNQITDFTPVTFDAEIVALCDSLIKEEASGNIASPLIVIGKVYELLGLLYRRCLCEPVLSAPDSKFKNVIDYINNNFHNDISSFKLSLLFGYDEAYFCRRFKAVTGLTPMNYIQILRLESAKKKIKSEKLNISEVSALCGFKDASYFTRCFKKRYGVTPAEYAKSSFAGS
jgi:AraC-like DNA-binding protein